MNGRGLLAAVAALGLMVGTPGVADAKVAARAKTAKVKRKPVRRVAAGVRVRPAVATAPVSTPLPFPPPVERPAVYRWLDDAGAMTAAVGDTRPDLAFRDGDAVRYAWRLEDGSTVIAEPMGPGDTRFYFYDVDMAVPFLVRDRLYSFGFARGALAAVFDVAARAVTPVAWQERVGADLYARGRQLWFAAQTPQRATPAPAVDLGVGGWSGDDRWERSDGRWRADRTDAERERRRAREERYRREHAARRDRDRRAPGGGRDGRAPGGWAGPVRDGDGQAERRNGGERTRPARPLTPPVADAPVPMADAATPVDRPRRDRERRRETVPPAMVAPVEAAPTPVALAPVEAPQPSRDADEPRREREDRREREAQPTADPPAQAREQAPVQAETALVEAPAMTERERPAPPEPERPARAEPERPSQARERVTDVDTSQPNP